jgi:hypothetical protein
MGGVHVLMAYLDLVSVASSQQPLQLLVSTAVSLSTYVLMVIVSATLGGLVHDFKLVFFLLLISLDRSA